MRSLPTGAWCCAAASWGPPSIPGTGDRYETVLRRIGSADSHVIGFAADGERSASRPAVDQMPFFGSAIPLRDGEWNLYVRRPAAGRTPWPKSSTTRTLGDVTGQRVPVGRKQYRLMVTGTRRPGDHRRAAAAPGGTGRSSASGRCAAGSTPRCCAAPRSATRLLRQLEGQELRGNPLGIAEELRRRGDDREHLWAITDWSVPVPEGGTGVLRGTEEYYEALAGRST